MKNGYFDKRRNQQLANLPEFTENVEFPTNALIEVTNGCNHACIFCMNSYQKRRSTFLPLSLYTIFVEQAVELGLQEVGLYATGEPFMVKNLDEYIAVAKKAGVKRVYITSNGALSDLETVKKCVRSGLDSIKFSINAGNREDYKTIHNYDDFDKVLENVRSIYKWKVREGIDLQLLGSCVLIASKPHTRQQHEQIFGEFFEDIAYHDAASQGGQKFDIPYSETELKNIFHKQPEIEDDEIEPCSMLWDRYHLTAEGYLTACCVDYNLNLVFADLKEEGLDTAWNNSFIRSLRRKHINRELEGTICKQCLKNKKCGYRAIRDVPSKNRYAKGA